MESMDEIEIARVQKVREAFDFFSTDWWDGDLETLMEMRTNPGIAESLEWPSDE